MNVEFIGFPAETPQFYSKLIFKKYSRPTPRSNATQNTEAYYRLPIPASLTDQYGMEITDVKLDLAESLFNGNLYTAGAGRIEQYMNEFGNLSDYRGKGFEGLKKILGAIPGATQNLIIDTVALAPGVSDSKLGRLAQSTIGMVRNPHHTVVFDGVQLKSYTFGWKLSPRSQQEAISLERMITNIKKYMHPKLSKTGFSMEYPYLTELQFEVGDNKLIPNVKTSFLKSLTVNGSAGGVPSFYRDGRSTIVELAMSFQEINVQTREDFMTDAEKSSELQ